MFGFKTKIVYDLGQNQKTTVQIAYGLCKPELVIENEFNILVWF